jgi:hypothetical protein
MSPNAPTASPAPEPAPPVRYGLLTWLAAPVLALGVAAAVYGFTPARRGAGG